MDGSFPACEALPISTLRSRFRFFVKRPRVTVTACRSGTSTTRYEAVAMCNVEEHGEAGLVSLEEFPWASLSSHALCLPVELPDEFESLSLGEFNLSFRVGDQDELSIAASEGGLEPSEADDSAEPAPTGAESQSKADAEMVAVLAWAAKSIELEWSPPPCPERSRLDYWFLGAEHDTKLRSTPVPFFPECTRS